MKSEHKVTQNDKTSKLPTSDIQILKVREMKDILQFKLDITGTGEEQLIPISPSQGFEKASYKASELRKEIEPWLTSLFQSEHLSLLAGAGLTNAVHSCIVGKLPEGFKSRTYNVFDKQIQTEAQRSAIKSGRGAPNPEDQLRTALKISEGLRILLEGQSIEDEFWKTLVKDFDALEMDIEETVKLLVEGILNSEKIISPLSDSTEPKPSSSIIHNRLKALRLLVSFLMSFASRTGTRDRLHIFTINYDRLIEFGAELAGLRLVDRFIGSLTPIFRASRLDIDFHYNPPGMRGEPRYLEGVTRFTKLHGSLDWIDDDREVRRIGLPFGARSYEPYALHGVEKVLIYPKDAKDRETADYPYVELFRDFAAALCRPNSVLVTYGYSFGDDHINRVIQDMLTIPSTHLVAINYDNTGERLTRFYELSKRTSQISLIIGKHFGDLGNLVDYYLPKPAIDKASIRMSELLRARGYIEKDDFAKPEINADISQLTGNFENPLT